MKRQLLLSLTLMLLTANAFALPGREQRPSAEFKNDTPVLHLPVAQDERMVLKYQRVG